MTKWLSKSIKTLHIRITKIIPLIFFISSCAGIPANKINLESYKKAELNKNLDLSYELRTHRLDDKGLLNFNSVIKKKLQSFVNKKSDSKCSAEIVSYTGSGTIFNCPVPLNLISLLTLTVIPYYCQHIYQANAALISYPSPESLKGKAININPNQVNFSTNQANFSLNETSNSKETKISRSGNSGKNANLANSNHLASPDKSSNSANAANSSNLFKNAKANEIQETGETDQIFKSSKTASKNAGKTASQMYEVSKLEFKNGKKGNYILTQDNQKIYEGEYFFDENFRLVHLLKTYELKDKVHEYWSLIALLGEITVAIIHPSTIRNSNISTPERAKSDTESTISEALTRSILNDASSFEECKKDQALPLKRK